MITLAEITMLHRIMRDAKNANVEALYAVLYGAQEARDFALIDATFDALVDAGVRPLEIVSAQNDHLSALRAAKIAERLRMFGLEGLDASC